MRKNNQYHIVCWGDLRDLETPRIYVDLHLKFARVDMSIMLIIPRTYILDNSQKSCLRRELVVIPHNTLVVYATRIWWSIWDYMLRPYHNN